MTDWVSEAALLIDPSDDETDFAYPRGLDGLLATCEQEGKKGLLLSAPWWCMKMPVFAFGVSFEIWISQTKLTGIEFVGS